MKQGIIHRVSEPTESVNSLVYFRKSNSRFRLCLECKDLNRAIMWCHWKTPIMEELVHKISDAKNFSKQNTKNEYRSILNHSYWPLSTLLLEGIASRECLLAW